MCRSVNEIDNLQSSNKKSHGQSSMTEPVTLESKTLMFVFSITTFHQIDQITKLNVVLNMHPLCNLFCFGIF